MYTILRNRILLYCRSASARSSLSPAKRSTTDPTSQVAHLASRLPPPRRDHAQDILARQSSAQIPFKPPLSRRRHLQPSHRILASPQPNPPITFQPHKLPLDIILPLSFFPLPQLQSKPLNTALTDWRRTVACRHGRRGRRSPVERGRRGEGSERRGVRVPEYPALDSGRCHGYAADEEGVPVHGGV